MADGHKIKVTHAPQWDEWLTSCECGWTGSYHRTVTDARIEGDRHLVSVAPLDPDVQEAVDKLRDEMSAVIETYSQGVPWSLYVGMLSALNGSIERMLKDHPDVPWTAIVAGSKEGTTNG